MLGGSSPPPKLSVSIWGEEVEPTLWLGSETGEMDSDYIVH